MKTKILLIFCTLLLVITTGIGLSIADESVWNPGYSTDPNYGYTPGGIESESSSGGPANWVEQVSERNKNTKKYEDTNNEGHYAIDSSLGAVHYKDDPSDPDEQWKDIDTTLESAVAPWDWQMVKSGYHVRVLEDFKAGQVIEFEKQGEYVRFQPMALQYTNDLNQIQSISMPQTPTSVDITDNTITWYDAYGSNLDFSWSCGNTRLLKLLTVNNFSDLPTIASYIEAGGNPVIELNLIFAPSTDLDCYVDGALWDKSSKVSTFGIIEWKKDGETLFGFMPNWYWDSSGNPPETPALTTLKKSGGSLYVSIRIPYSWIESAVYPIYIDTIIDEQVDTSGHDGWARSTGLFDSAGVEATVGHRDSPGYHADAFAYFDNGISGLSGATIDLAQFKVYGSTQYGSPLTNVYAEDSASPSAPTTQADLEGRARTTAFTAQDATITSGAWNTIVITDVIQELADSYDPSTILILHDDDGSGDGDNAIKWRTYDYSDNTYGPQLYIEYTAGGATYEPRPGTALGPSGLIFDISGGTFKLWESIYTIGYNIWKDDSIFKLN